MSDQDTETDLISRERFLIFIFTFTINLFILQIGTFDQK